MAKAGNLLLTRETKLLTSTNRGLIEILDTPKPRAILRWILGIGKIAIRIYVSLVSFALRKMLNLDF